MHSRLKGNEVFLLARTLAPELGKKERAIARFIDDNPQSLARMSITEIANYLKVREGANKQVISSQADSLIKISRIWADFFPANTSNQPI